MGNNLREAINGFDSQPSVSNKKQLNYALFLEILDAVKGLKKILCRASDQIFRVGFDNPEDQRGPDAFPDYIDWHGKKKDFSEMLIKLHKDLMKKICNKGHRSHDKTLLALKGNEQDRKMWIRSTLGFICNNKLFEEEIKSYKNKKKHILQTVAELFKNNANNFTNYNDIEGLIKKTFNEDIHQTLKTEFSSAEIACWALLNAFDSVEDVSRWIKGKFGKDSINENDIPHYKKRIEEQILRYLPKSQEPKFVPVPEDLGDDEDSEWSTMESDMERLIDWQKEAFFWIPDKPFRGESLEGRGADRAVYIAFFYSWLRRCSYATFEEIAGEAGVSSASTVSRNWKPHLTLERPFPDKAVGVIHPVYFSDSSRSSIGLHDTNIRCYPGPYDGKKYAQVFGKKEILWNIYELLINDNMLDQMMHLYDKIEEVLKKKGYCFSGEIKYSDDIGLNGKKVPNTILYIKSIQEENS